MEWSEIDFRRRVASLQGPSCQWLLGQLGSQTWQSHGIEARSHLQLLAPSSALHHPFRPLQPVQRLS